MREHRRHCQRRNVARQAIDDRELTRLPLFGEAKLSIWGNRIYSVQARSYDTAEIAQAAEEFDVSQLRTTSMRHAAPAYPMCGQIHAVTSAQRGDPWTATISQLEQISEHAIADDDDQNEEVYTEAPADKRRRVAELASIAATYGRNAVVTFVERIGAKAVSISWRDSTGGNYREQRWVQRAARSRGVCALTGEAISRGDSIYHPVSGSRGRPSNLAQMIRTEALERFE
ncbi:DUF3331 domain-containing protein [Paraburkholderia sp.]|uniref:DUF3331 domain-containing protein n=1 Tax=Paraburkholderia sp. TaxID=1926495 RepID=UPI0025E5BC7B|nr:DUF3331 domain-containing protein [Paraburkholderia sp.]